ncbi:protein iq-domain 31 [Phtheirospermum japonicum]|uniref:Protein iq-domain 31 n=1 Tax=Phtheirospermum japonicum TaxID=374723 RepID=A0A830AYN7_9LAMI|nr:protein iq-domain 31 [Phtheirospermum japonicum]
MGKSPGKWIKTVLFGKKYSKSNFSKNVTAGKKTVTKTPVEDLSRNSPVISDPYPLTEIGVETLDLQNGAHCDTTALSPVNQDVNSQINNMSIPVIDTEVTRLDQAAAKAQAAFRGYLARRAFRALKGIIRLQALIRGHLVRRQAVATLRCMRVIVKFQALARGRKDAKQVGIGANSFSRSEKLATNTFVRKLLLKMPTAMPLSLQYDVAEPNSSWSWLERWSVSRFWDPPARTKKITKPKPQRKLSSLQTVEPEAGKSKRTIRKAPTASNGENSALASETDKPKRNLGKIVGNQTELAQEQAQAQSELERVKRNLRKVSLSSSAQVPEKPERETEKPQPLQSVDIAKASSPADVPVLEIANSPKNLADSDVVGKMDSLETPLKNEPIDVPNDDNNNHPVVETRSEENGVKIESAPNVDDGSSVKEEQISKENQKIKKRRSLPAKQEFTEKISNNSLSVPSYMAATESAKAKLKAQGASKIVEDAAVAEYGNNNARRHSLPASTNGKLSSLSPRIQKPVQANGKGGIKTNATLTASRDGGSARVEEMRERRSARLEDGGGIA